MKKLGPILGLDLKIQCNGYSKGDIFQCKCYKPIQITKIDASIYPIFNIKVNSVFITTNKLL